jgi:hypothetical protein
MDAMKRKVARICLIVAVVLLVFGGFILGHAPVWFGVAAGFALGAVVLGSRRIRVSGVVLVAVSTFVAFSEMHARQVLHERAESIQRKASRAALPAKPENKIHDASLHADVPQAEAWTPNPKSVSPRDR